MGKVLMSGIVPKLEAPVAPPPTYTITITGSGNYNNSSIRGNVYTLIGSEVITTPCTRYITGGTSITLVGDTAVSAGTNHNFLVYQDNQLIFSDNNKDTYVYTPTGNVTIQMKYTTEYNANGTGVYYAYFYITTG